MSLSLADLNKVHAHSSWAYGLLPPTLNILNLLFASVAIASGLWIYNGAIAGLLGFLPVYAQTLAGILGLTAANFWFSREIQTIVLNVKEAESGNKFDNNNINLRKTFKFTNKLVNNYFSKIFKEKHKDLKLGRLGVFEAKDQGYKFVGAPGRDAGNSIYVISQAVLDKHSKMLPKHIAVWMLKEQVKAYYHRGWSNLIVSMFESWANTLSSLQASDSFLNKCLWLLASPLQFFLLLPKMVKRSHDYDAWKQVAQMGFGFEAIQHLDIKSNRNRNTRLKPWKMFSRKAKQFSKRTPYNGWFAGILRPAINWIDRFLEKNEWAWDDKSDWRLLSVVNAIFLNVGRWVQELFADAPSGYNVKEVLKDEIEGYRQAESELKAALRQAYKLSNGPELKKAKKEAITQYQKVMDAIEKRERAKQNELIDPIPLEKRYGLLINAEQNQSSDNRDELASSNVAQAPLTPQAQRIRDQAPSLQDQVLQTHEPANDGNIPPSSENRAGV